MQADGEAFILWNLHDAVEAQRSLAMHDPTPPTTEWLDGFGAGRRKGLVEGLAVAHAAVSGGSPAALLADLYLAAEVDTDFPFDLVVVEPGENYPEE